MTPGCRLTAAGGWKEIKMHRPKLAVQIVSSGILPDDALMLGERFFKLLKIPSGGTVTLKFGFLRATVRTVPVKRFGGVRIGSGLAARMGIPGGTVRIHYRPSARLLSLGPVIGVLVSRDYPRQSDRPLGDITGFGRELTEACAAQGAFVYFFTPDHIGAAASGLEAWVFDGRWRKTRVPAPDVVNNRLTSRKLENNPSVQHFLQEVKSANGNAVFNEKFLDKSEVFDALGRDGKLSKYLPESRTLQSFAVLRSMCTRHGVVFLKPVRGSLGKGIIRITRQAGGYQAAYTTGVGTLRKFYPSIQKLFDGLRGKMKTVRYQIQQGLPLIEIQGRPVDFRALVQKDGTGAWRLTSIVARIAGGQHFVSNLARGGKLCSVAEAAAKSSLAASARRGAGARLGAAALDIAKGIDAGIPHHFGELGVDLAMDGSGRVWLLEVNSKPSKNDNTPLNDNKIRPSVRILVQYARHVSGF